MNCFLISYLSNISKGKIMSILPQHSNTTVTTYIVYHHADGSKSNDGGKQKVGTTFYNIYNL